MVVGCTNHLSNTKHSLQEARTVVTYTPSTDITPKYCQLPAGVHSTQKGPSAPSTQPLQVCASCFSFLTNCFKAYVFLPILGGPTLLGKMQKIIYILSRQNQLIYLLQKIITSHKKSSVGDPRVCHCEICRQGNCPARRGQQGTAILSYC